jgi:peptide-methionine (S)-S-oxide reductase
MKIAVLIAVMACSLLSCAQVKTAPITIPVGSTTGKSPHEQVATFAEGCFWHAEIVFQSLAGVRDAVSGYAGGNMDNPDYDKVATGLTGHAESVNVYYDPDKVSYETLVKAFFASQDPTTKNRQGNDQGTEYRSIAFYRMPQEKAIINAEIASLNQSGRYSNKIVTEVVPFTKFYPAEDYHQEYISRNPDNMYVQSVSIPEFEAFKRTFKGNFK